MSDNIVEDTQDSTEVKKEVSQKLNKKKLSFQKLSIFPNGIQHEDDMLAALSLVFYAAITLIPVIKYVFIVLRANDNGEVILIMLFMLQRFGTDKVGYTSAPIICIWFISIAGIGIYNFFKFDPTVLTAFNPKYIIEYFQRNKKEAWISLGGIVFAMTGTVALFADLGHFTIRSIQISMCSVTYPAVILAYIGQASFLRKNSDLVSQTFYKSLPRLAVVFVMTLTSCFLVVVMIMIWKTHILLIISYILIICTVELIFFSSVLYKFVQGGYLPLAFAAVLMSVMYVWNNVFRKKYYYELENKISPEKLKEIVANRNFYQISGLALFYSVLVQGIPTIFKHYIENVPAIHSILIFVSIKSLLINKVPVKELFLFHRVEPRELNVFRCVVRYGHIDVQKKD
ncbi:probable potassium transporter 16 [Quercus suber]|uniref:probable potassium transporter 16 n=1 Tax=Quercus suber TaxID=58331 RepID=UPI0032DE3522